MRYKTVRKENDMKIFRRALYFTLIACLVIFVAAIFFRIYMNEHYPKDSVRIVFTEKLTDYYESADDFRVYTQKLRTPYDKTKGATFFAEELYLVPEAEHLQITLRYNEKSLENVKEYYKLDALPEIKEEMFRYELRISYNTDENGTDYVTVPLSYYAEYTAYGMYRYDKLAFDGADFDGAAWMCIDIYLDGQDEKFGSVLVYESNFEFDGKLYPYGIDEKRIPKGDLPK